MRNLALGFGISLVICMLCGCAPSYHTVEVCVLDSETRASLPGVEFFDAMGFYGLGKRFSAIEHTEHSNRTDERGFAAIRIAHHSTAAIGLDKSGYEVLIIYTSEIFRARRILNNPLRQNRLQLTESGVPILLMERSPSSEQE